jgi:integrase
MKTDPMRRCMPVAEWPLADRAAWERAARPGDPLEPGGRASHCNAYSLRKYAKGYGRWLTWLAQRGELDQDEAPGARATQARVVAYIADLLHLNGKQTVLNRVQELRNVLAVMAPETDWSWINRLATCIRARPDDPNRKRARLRSSAQLYALGVRRMRQADEASSISPLQRAIRFRDGLIIALLAARPLRRKNLCALRLGHHVARRGATLWIGIPGEETKNGRPIEVPLPEELSRAMDRYLCEHRPVLAQGRTLEALWVSSRAKPMHEVSVYCQVRRITKETFGAPINPHLFRDAAATTLAIEDPEHVRIASQMLGHSSLRVTERHYNQARMVEAARRYQEGVRARRQGLCAKGFPAPGRSDKIGGVTDQTP